MKGRLISTVIKEDTTLDFQVLSDGLGIRHLSIHNKGGATLIIDDATQEEIKTGESFYLETHLALINTDFRLKFKEDENKEKKAFIRYIVEVVEVEEWCEE